MSNKILNFDSFVKGPKLEDPKTALDVKAPLIFASISSTFLGSRLSILFIILLANSSFGRMDR